MNTILCGMPRCGKTTVGKLLASKLKRPFIDTDSLVRKAYFLKTGRSRTCREIFAEEGEAAFRIMEKQQIALLKQQGECVISLGGGVLNDPDNIAILKSIGKMIYLKTDLNVLWERMQKEDLPAFLDPRHPEQALHALACERLPIYENVADATIEIAQLNPEQLVNHICNIIERSYGK